MKNRKRIGALALVLTLALAACAGGAKTPGDAVKASQEKMAAVKSMDSTMVMETEISAGGQTLSMNTSMKMSLFADPMQMKIDMTVDMGPLGAQTLNAYAQMEGDSYTIYAQNGDTWTAQTMSADMMGQYDSRKSLDLYLSSASSFTADGTEKLDSGEADKYNGVISGDSLEEVIKNTGAMDSMSTILGGDTAALEDMYKDMGDLPITIWVDKTTGYPVRYTMDMTAMMAKVMEKALAATGSDASGAGLEVSKMSMTMNCSNFDKATAFTIPEEALAAKG